MRRSLTILAALLAGCGGRGSGPADTSLLTLAVASDVTGIFPNPPIQAEAFTVSVNRNVYETLLAQDGEMQLVPALAERWENPDDRTYVFVLRADARFSDGRPVTARDVAASLLAARARRWVSHEQLADVTSVRALSDRRLEVRTSAVSGMLLNRMIWGFVLPADVVDRSPVPAIGSGPYAVERWVPGQELVLARNPHHPRPPPFVRVRYVVVKDDAERVRRALAGEVDVAARPPLSRLDELERSGAVKVVTRPGVRVSFLALRVDRPPFDDPRVREAMDRGIDRAALVRRVFAGHGQPATQVVPAAVLGFAPSVPVTAAVPAASAALLAAAGHPGGLEVQLDVADYNAELGRAVAEQLAGAGFRVRVDALPTGEFWPLVDGGRSAFHLLDWQCDSGDASEILEALFHSRTSGALGAYNSIGLADRELDALVERAAGQSGERRAATLRQAMERTVALRATVPLVVPIQAVLVSPRIEWDPPLGLALRPEQMRARPASDR